jgi:hypothetical protein
MPIEHEIWKISEQPERLSETSLLNENELEEMISHDVRVLNHDWLIIGRQVLTGYGKRIDLLGIDATGSLIVIELKKGRTPREVMAQALEYASWIKTLKSDQIAEIYESFNGSLINGKATIDEAFLTRFSTKLDEDELNASHLIVIVASELDSATERIVNYLNDFDLPINVVFFKVFQDGESRYLSRAWLIDPATTHEKATTPRHSEPWNGEFYVSFGHDLNRDWEDARKYGFISAGGGKWYTQTLFQLQKGDRVWVNIPHTGYVGVGLVTEPTTIISEFTVNTDKGPTAILEAPAKGKYHHEHLGDEENSEYFVQVEWLKDVPLKKAISEIGFFGNQNTVAKPTSPKWQHTIDRLKDVFQIK